MRLMRERELGRQLNRECFANKETVTKLLARDLAEAHLFCRTEA